MKFKDHFSGQSASYSRYRPTYPEALFKFLASLVSVHHLAWDCGTGSGQAAVGLSYHFGKVIATDASGNQIANAQLRENITYKVGPAEKTDIPGNSVNLVTVAQALHWFDFEKFYKEVRRVAKKEAVLAAWTYGLFSTQPEIDHIINRFFNEIIYDFWPEERKYIEAKYETIPFPFKKIQSPEFKIEAKYSLDDLHKYLLTWSAVQKYIQQKKHDPFDLIQDELEKAWTGKKKVNWPISLLAGRIFD